MVNDFLFITKKNNKWNNCSSYLFSCYKIYCIQKLGHTKKPIPNRPNQILFNWNRAREKNDNNSSYKKDTHANKRNKQASEGRDSMSQRDTCETRLFWIQTAFGRLLLHAKHNHDNETAAAIATTTTTSAAVAYYDVN